MRSGFVRNYSFRLILTSFLNPAGGSGIHRPLRESQDIGADYKSKVRLRKNTNINLRMFHETSFWASPLSSLISQKGKGDVKRRGKLDPYAYIPLKKDQLNRRYGGKKSLGWNTYCLQNITFKHLFFICRKRAKLKGQFKGMVRGAQKGALSGRKMQKKKKAWKENSVDFVCVMMVMMMCVCVKPRCVCVWELSLFLNCSLSD